MRGVIIILLIFLATPSMCQKRFEILLGTGIGNYMHEDLKDFQQVLESAWSGYGLKTTDNFPPYFNFSGVLNYKISRGVSIGLAARMESTGYRSSYADYSGNLVLDQKLVVYEIGISGLVDCWSNDQFAVSIQNNLFWSATTITFSSELNLTGVQMNLDESNSFISNSIVINPNLDVVFKVTDNFNIHTIGGYSIDTGGDLKFKVNKDFKLPLRPGRYVASDWSGWRIGLAFGFLL